MRESKKPLVWGCGTEPSGVDEYLKTSRETLRPHERHRTGRRQTRTQVGHLRGSETAISRITALILAAPQGFEPRYADPESAVLPLNEGAVSGLGEGCSNQYNPAALILWAVGVVVNTRSNEARDVTKGVVCLRCPPRSVPVESDLATEDMPRVRTARAPDAEPSGFPPVPR